MSDTTLQDKLKEVSELMASTVGEAVKETQSFVCPIDPAERALCEACQ